MGKVFGVIGVASTITVIIAASFLGGVGCTMYVYGKIPEIGHWYVDQLHQVIVGTNSKEA